MAVDNDVMHVPHQLADVLRAALIGLGVLGLGSLWVMAADDASGETRDLRVESSCQGFVVHRPRQDVAYQAGADARGNAVAPADMDYGDSLRLDNVTIELKAPLSLLAPQLQILGRVPALGASEVAVGNVTVDLTGGVASFNGQDLSAAQQRRWAEECQAPRSHTVR